MILVCIDYLKLDWSKGGYENILVITDHFTRYPYAIPTRNQTARTTARVIFDNFFLQFGSPTKLHKDQDANFESRVIKSLCKLKGIKKTRTTPYHPMGNDMVEGFNRTLLNMIGPLTDKQHSDWKTFVPTLCHAYNADSTGQVPFLSYVWKPTKVSCGRIPGPQVIETCSYVSHRLCKKTNSRLASHMPRHPKRQENWRQT